MVRRRLIGALSLAAALVVSQTADAFYYRYQTREARMTAIVTDIGSNGRLRLYPSNTGAAGSTPCSGTIIADLALSATAGVVATAGSVDSGPTTLTFNAITSATATASNTATCATITTSGGTIIVNALTVGTSGTNVVLNSNVISSGQTVSVTSAVLTHG
jgi:hypothetical protein